MLFKMSAVPVQHDRHFRNLHLCWSARPLPLPELSPINVLFLTFALAELLPPLNRLASIAAPLPLRIGTENRIIHEILRMPSPHLRQSIRCMPLPFAEPAPTS